MEVNTMDFQSEYEEQPRQSREEEASLKKVQERITREYETTSEEEEFETQSKRKKGRRELPKTQEIIKTTNRFGLLEEVRDKPSTSQSQPEPERSQAPTKIRKTWVPPIVLKQRIGNTLTFFFLPPILRNF